MPFFSRLNKPRKRFDKFDQSIEDTITLWRTILQVMKKKREITEIVALWNKGQIKKAEISLSAFKSSTALLLEQAPRAIEGARARDLLVQTMLSLVRDQSEDFGPYRRANHHLIPVNFDRVKANNVIRFDLDGMAMQITELEKLWKRQLKIIEKSKWVGDVIKDIINDNELKQTLEEEESRYKQLNEYLTKLIHHVDYLCNLEKDDFKPVFEAEQQVIKSLRDHSDIIRDELAIGALPVVEDILLLTLYGKSHTDRDLLHLNVTDINKIKEPVFLIVLVPFGSENTYKIVARVLARDHYSLPRKHSIMTRLGMPMPEIRLVDEDRHIVFEEFIEGMHFGDFVKNIASFSHTICVRAFSELGAHIGNIHSKGYVHGDLAADNVMVHLEGGDYLGLKFIDIEYSEKTNDASRLTREMRTLLSSVRLDTLPEYLGILREAYLQATANQAFAISAFDDTIPFASNVIRFDEKHGQYYDGRDRYEFRLSSEGLITMLRLVSLSKNEPVAECVANVWKKNGDDYSFDHPLGRSESMRGQIIRPSFIEKLGDFRKGNVAKDIFKQDNHYRGQMLTLAIIHHLWKEKASEMLVDVEHEELIKNYDDYGFRRIRGKAEGALGVAMVLDLSRINDSYFKKFWS